MSRIEDFERFGESLEKFSENIEYSKESWETIPEIVKEENERFARERKAIMPTREDFQTVITI